MLKHKIVDLMRQRAGTDGLDVDDEDGAALAIECPNPRPDEPAEQRQFLARTLERIEVLSARLRDVVRLGVLQDESTSPVCEQLAINVENLFGRLHRA